MRYDLQKWARSLELRPPSLKAVLVYLASRANKENCCWPSQQTISADTGHGESTVQRGLAELESLGYIRREKRNASKRGPRTDLIYVLGPAPAKPQCQPVREAKRRARQGADANEGTPQIGGSIPPNQRGAPPKSGPLYKEELSEEISKKGIRDCQAGVARDDGKVLVERDSPEWCAWQTYLRTVLGKPGSAYATLTADDGRLVSGWRFASRWPPGHVQFSEAAE
ncbi:helix-turn-helix domain-containing protein [Tepidamorphus sp. 3E244]|uniref:helix-turn-helix domain-containing protein n=1 Tax=Tepidamorphus sp. 3E244 TaxID=3385498 RepID=UPI0038FCEAB1